jgi:hypothetical protein
MIRTARALAEANGPVTGREEALAAPAEGVVGDVRDGLGDASAARVDLVALEGVAVCVLAPGGEAPEAPPAAAAETSTRADTIRSLTTPSLSPRRRRRSAVPRG